VPDRRAVCACRRPFTLTAHWRALRRPAIAETTDKKQGWTTMTGSFALWIFLPLTFAWIVLCIFFLLRAWKTRRTPTPPEESTDDGDDDPQAAKREGRDTQGGRI
jgi:TRAP-type C4-dicarboxylate transport system permease small subunit